MSLPPDIEAFLKPRPNPPQTRRERVAIGALQALLASAGNRLGGPEEFNVARQAVTLADALIEELDK